ncbi:MAG: translation elongation factor-like protein [Candidatus Woykebacteria bacterium]
MAKEKEIGKVSHFYDKISVGVVKLSDKLKVGDKIHIQGSHDDFKQTVESMQLEHKPTDEAKKGNEVAIKVAQKVHDNDKVYKVED